MQLGITEIFENTATLPLLARGGTSEGKLKVSNIIQKSGIDVNEKGELIEKQETNLEKHLIMKFDIQEPPHGLQLKLRLSTSLAVSRATLSPTILSCSTSKTRPLEANSSLDVSMIQFMPENKFFSCFFTHLIHE